MYMVLKILALHSILTQSVMNFFQLPCVPSYNTSFFCNNLSNSLQCSYVMLSSDIDVSSLNFNLDFRIKQPIMYKHV